MQHGWSMTLCEQLIEAFGRCLPVECFAGSGVECRRYGGEIAGGEQQGPNGDHGHDSVGRQSTPHIEIIAEVMTTISELGDAWVYAKGAEGKIRDALR
jgi:hypothetical protein